MAAAETAVPAPRRRDADTTRALLLEAARRRFASDGYSATTVRSIADDAGVNVALISRYFTSKEGLFEVCLAVAVGELGRTVAGDLTPEQVPLAMAAALAGSPAGSYPNQLLLLLRSSGDEGADQLRLDTLRYFTERVASFAGWRPGQPSSDRLLLRAQIVLAAAMGIAMLRSFEALEPLASAGEQDLLVPLQDLIATLLARP